MAVLVTGLHPGAPQARAAEPGVGAPVMIVLDASGSMTTADAPGPRIDAAKRAVTGLVRRLPDAARVGLLVYGTGTSSATSAKPAGCRDVHVLVPVSDHRRSTLLHAVAGVRARGYTPIGASLTRAARSLPAGPAGIVLVSDGEDTCGPPGACTVAAGLERSHPDLVIHTIGFRVDRRAREQLRCIAGATGGSYRDADDGPALGDVLRTQVGAGLRPYVATGTPIDGTPTPQGAPPVTAGQYTDMFPSGGAVTKHYSIDLVARETVHVATTIIPPALRGGGTDARLEVVVELTDSDGHRCLSTEREHDAVLAGKVDPVTALLSGVVGGTDWSKRCGTGGRFVVAVTRDSASTTATHSETVVRFEAPVAPVPPPIRQLPAGLPGPAAGAATRACTGGVSYDDAPTLGGGTCTDTLSTGETRYYRVRLAWGQRLAYRIVVGRVAGAGHGVGEVRSAVTTPLRQGVTLASTSNAARDFGGPVATAVSGSTLVDVAYGNRNSTRSDVRPYSTAGDWFLSLGMSYPADRVPYETGVAVTVRVVGAAQPGPHYLSLPSSRATPAAPSSTGPAAPGAPRAGEPAASTSTAWIWWTVAGVLVVVPGAVVASRRRARR